MQKLTPNEDLQCYFFIPTAIAALSNTSSTGFTVSGKWRQQFDWTVIEWNRDNTFEHPLFRNLPDGDLSGISLSYKEVRTNCIPLDSTLFATVDWPSLRVWANDSTGTEHIYWINIAANATAIVGSYTAASASFTLSGTTTSGDYIELVCDYDPEEHYTYELLGTDTLDTALAELANAINTFSTVMEASTAGAVITLTLVNSNTGANGNRVGIYSTVHGAGTETWSSPYQTMSGGTSPTQWQVSFNFSSITGNQDSATGTVVTVPMNAVRKMRWTFAAPLAPENFAQQEFSVVVSDWTVSGSNLTYSVAGPGSWFIYDTDINLKYSTGWSQTIGNFWGGSIHSVSTSGAMISYNYTAQYTHTLYLGTQRLTGSGTVSITVDGGTPQVIDTALSSEQVLVRVSLGILGIGNHTINLTTTNSNTFYFGFFEMVVPITNTPTLVPYGSTTLATDWDTYQSQSIAPERTAGMLAALGFTGRTNHYVGALWFYELVNPSNVFAFGTFTFTGSVQFGDTTTVSLGTTTLTHVNTIGDNLDSLAIAFMLIINNGATGVWASVAGNVLTVTSRELGTTGNGLVLSATVGGSTTLTVACVNTAGGVDGTWLTDLVTIPPVNRAARDWSLAYFVALEALGIDCTASFSMELGNGDPSTGAGIAQRYPDGSPVLVNTPALQTNFSPTSLAYWKQAFLCMAGLMATAGLVPYLQFGETQWWYFCPPVDPPTNWTPTVNGGMPFYDDYTVATFLSTYSVVIHTFLDPSDSPSAYPNESAFLPGLIGAFVAAIQAFVSTTYSNCRYEVLYPPDTNDSPLMSVMNLPSTWVPTNLNCFKTENFTYTGDFNINAALASILLPKTLDFSVAESAHLIGIGNYQTPWNKERLLSLANVGTTVLFALDQFCLIGYPLPLVKTPGSNLWAGHRP
jgi:hypothetical protein